jgi:hypothetical protein
MLQKPQQDALLWAMQTSANGGHGNSSSSDSESNPSRRPARTWHLNGKQLCRQAFCLLLGVGNHRLQRTSSRLRGKDFRSLEGASPDLR